MINDLVNVNFMVFNPLPALIPALLLIVSCRDQPPIAIQNSTTGVTETLPFYPGGGKHPSDSLTYEEVKSDIRKTRAGLAQKNLPTDSLSSLFTGLLVDRIIPYWYGTPWSFEGHTTIPGEGTIACGYFVSTTLTDMGLNVNRFKLAQQWPEDEAMTLSLNKPLLIVTDTTPQGIITQLKNRLKDGVYFAGLDQSHVGYLLKWKDDLFFIHSNYYMAKGVEMERASESIIFGAFRRIFVAEISTNDMLLKRWVNGTEVKVIIR